MTPPTPEGQTIARPLAVVTGASSGIGYHLAREFARNGYDLFLVADNALDAVAQEVQVLGAAVQTLTTDLASFEGVEELYAAVTTTGKPLDVVAINAGVGVGGRFIETALADEVRVVELNVLSSLHLAKLAAQDMARRRTGKILFTSSAADRMPSPFYAVYGASKAFIQSLSQALRVELGDHGISVTAVLPGPTETQLFERAGMQDTPIGAMDKDDPAQVAEQAVTALIDGKDHIVAGSASTRAQTHAAALAPETATARAHRRLSEPGDDTDDE